MKPASQVLYPDPQLQINMTGDERKLRRGLDSRVVAWRGLVAHLAPRGTEEALARVRRGIRLLNIFARLQNSIIFSACRRLLSPSQTRVYKSTGPDHPHGNGLAATAI